MSPRPSQTIMGAVITYYQSAQYSLSLSLDNTIAVCSRTILNIGYSIHQGQSYSHIFRNPKWNKAF